MTLLERDAERTLLHELHAQARTGKGRVALITGEAGIGKTSLARSTNADLAAGEQLLVGTCDPLSTPSVHAPLFDLESALGSRVQSLLHQRAEPGLLFSAVLAALRELPGAIVVFEDIHWADDGTLDLLRYLSRRIDRAPVLLVVTSRTDELGANHKLRSFLGDLARTPGCVRIAPAPLSETAVAQMVGDRDIPPDLLYRRTGGNPYFVCELLATAETLPATVSDAVLGRWSRMSETAQSLVQLAAVLGSGVSSELLAAMSGSQVGPAIDEAISSGLLQVDVNGVSFRHELAREALFAAISPLRRQEIFRTALHTVPGVQPDIDPARMAHYATGANDADAIRVFNLRAAERAAALGASHQAAQHYGHALSAAVNQPAAVRIPILLGYADATTATGWSAVNLDVRNELIAHYRTVGDLRAEIEQLREIAISSFNHGRNADGEAAIGQALALLEDLPQDDLHARVYATRAMTLMLDRHTAEAIEWGNSAMRLAEELNDPLTVIRCQNAIGSAQIVSGDLAAGVQTLERAIAAANSIGQSALAINLRSNLGSASGEILELSTAEAAIAQCIDEARAADLDGPLSYALAWMALIRLYQGRWVESGQCASEALLLPHALAISRIMALVAQGRVRARRGDPDVWDALDEALALAEPTGTLQRVAPVAAARAEARWLAGDVDGTVAEARRGYQLAARHRHAWLAGELAFWLQLGGAAVTPDFEVAAPWRLQIAGDVDAAANEWAKRGCLYEAARAQIESDDASNVTQALRTFEQLGAAPMIVRATQRLRDLGVSTAIRGPRRSTRENAAGLTVRELEVLSLLASGATYAEIAEKLFLSSRTVEHHVSSILRKLDVRTRRDAVRIAIERNLLHGDVPVER